MEAAAAELEIRMEDAGVVEKISKRGMKEAAASIRRSSIVGVTK